MNPSNTTHIVSCNILKIHDAPLCELIVQNEEINFQEFLCHVRELKKSFRIQLSQHRRRGVWAHRGVLWEGASVSQLKFSFQICTYNHTIVSSFLHTTESWACCLLISETIQNRVQKHIHSSLPAHPLRINDPTGRTSPKPRGSSAAQPVTRRRRVPPAAGQRGLTPPPAHAQLLRGSPARFPTGGSIPQGAVFKPLCSLKFKQPAGL